MILSEDVIKPGLKLYHYKGYYTIVVTSIFEDMDGGRWVIYFIEDNATDKYKAYDGTFMKQFSGESILPEHITYERFYNDNTLRVVSMERFLERDKDGVSKLQLTKIVSDKGFTPTVIKI